MPDYVRPRTLADALAVRASRDVAIMAGGTDVYPAWTTRRGWGDPTHKDVLDISGITELKGIRREKDEWRLGALVTWSELAAADLPALFDGYRAAAQDVGGVQVQNRATLAGNICTASPAGDGIPCLMALDATIELASTRGVRRVPIEAFNIGYRETALAPDEIVTAIVVPAVDACSTFLKLGARRYLVISIAMVSAVIQVTPTGLIRNARIAVGACGPVARRLNRLEADLNGQPLLRAASLIQRAHLAPLEPIDDVRASAEYRLDAAEQLVRDALNGLVSSAQRRVA